jgi:Sec-independent protein secretion pathway component TatC
MRDARATSRPAANATDDMAVMSFGDHLDELRRRLILSLVAPLPLFIVLFFVSSTLVEFTLRPVYRVLQDHDLPAELQVLAPPELLVVQLKLSAILSLVLAAPWILYQGWAFIAPGLYRHERRFVLFLLPGSGVLTLAGLALLYYVMLPLMLHVLVLVATNVEVDAGGPRRSEAVQKALAEGEIEVVAAIPPEPPPGQVFLVVPDLRLFAAVPDDATGKVELVPVLPQGGHIAQTFRVASVVNFVLLLALGTTVAFQMPLVLLLAGWLGLVEASWLRARRKYAFFICAVIAAVITPADAASLLIMLVPLYGLYELGILLMVFVPASAVAEGRVLRFPRWRRAARPRSARRGGSTDKPAERPEQAIEPAQAVATVPRRRAGDDGPRETSEHRAGGGEDR